MQLNYYQVLPFDDESKENLFKKIKKSEYKYPPWFSPDVKSIQLTRIATNL